MLSLQPRAMATALLIVLSSLPVLAWSDQRAIIIADRCEYLLLNSNQGMVIIRKLAPASVQTGDTLVGEFTAGNFRDVTNTRTDESLRVWVDRVDRQSQRALHQYGRYCS